MGEHRPAPPTLQQRLYWPVAVACGAVMLAGTVGAAQAVAPQVAAAEHLALTPERSAEPSAHGGPLAPLSIGVVAPTDPFTERNTSWLAANAGVTGADSPRRTAPFATSTSGRSGGSTATGLPGTVSTPQGSPREAAGASSGSPTDPSGAPGSSLPTGSTLSTPPSSPSGTTSPDPATTTRTCRWCHHTSPAATTETTSAATTTEATETTSETEPSDPLATLLSDVLERQ